MDLDWQNPDYPAVFRYRLEALNRMRAHPGDLPALRSFYRDHPAAFISDWGCTFDPKMLERGLPALVPFVLFPKQIEWVDWTVALWREGKPGLTEKTRQSGMSWLSIALACTLCLFHRGMSIGFGSRKAELIDNLNDPKSLFAKARTFMQHLPPQFRGGWDVTRHAPHMRLMFPETGATITGESGDGIGRGNTTAIFFVDEAAFLERPQLVEQSLSQTTNCRIDISTPNGMNNTFAEKRFSGRVAVFTFGWRDDPRKSDAWYQKQVAELDPISVGQEIDIDYAATAEGAVIPNAWVQAAVDAHIRLGIEPTGARSASLDVADEGRDANAFCGTHGILVEFVVEWSGRGGDIYKTTLHAFGLCDLHRYTTLRYDADGLGAGVRGDANRINGDRASAGRPQIQVDAFRGSEAVLGPDGEDVKGRKNKDFFLNRKAQAWWSLRTRFQNTYRAVVEGQRPFDRDGIISIASNAKNLHRLLAELVQPTYSVNSIGKIVIDKAPGEGARSPNLADSVMMQFATIKRPPMRINPAAMMELGIYDHGRAGL